MKPATILAVLMITGTGAYASRDSIEPRNIMPNMLPVTDLLTKKVAKVPGGNLYELADGMLCLTPDSTFRSNMPVVGQRKTKKKPVR
jgi:hypothetical protein